MKKYLTKITFLALFLALSANSSCYQNERDERGFFTFKSADIYQK